MRRILIYLLFLLPPIVAAGCTGGVGDGDFLVSEMMDGKVVRTYTTSSQVAEISRDKISVKVSDDGKLSWSVNVDNPYDKRGYCTGVLTLLLVDGSVVDVSFGTSVEAGSVNLPVGEKDVVIKDLPTGWKLHDYNAAVVPCSLAETPTTHVRGNWPKTPLSVRYEVRKPEPKAKDAGEPAGIQMTADVIQSDFTGKKFTAKLVAKSSLDKEVVMDLELTFVGLDADEKPMVVNGQPVEYKKETTVGVKAFSTSKERTEEAAFDVKVKGCAVHVKTLKFRIMQ